MNKVVLIGRLSKDVDAQEKYARFTLAVNRPKDKDGNQEADFINCVAFGKTGETIAKYVHKGDRFAINGRIQTGSYDGKDGKKVYTTDVVVEGFDFIQDSNKSQPQDVPASAFQEVEDDIPF